MLTIRIAAVAGAVLLLQGCTTLKPTTLPANFWQQPGKKIAVSVAPLPAPSSTKLGAQGLLDVAINKAMANDWDSYIKSMVFEPYETLADDFVKGLSQRGYVAAPVKLDLGTLPEYKNTKDSKFPYEKDLSQAPALAQDDYALIITVNAVGTARSYYGFIPTSDPRGYFSGHAVLVDMKSNEEVWTKDLVVDQGAEKPWDQPPSYPNLSQAVDKAVESSRQQFVTALLSGNSSTPAQ